MASLFVQCKPEDGNGDSTDEEAAFPGLEEEEAPAPKKAVTKHVAWEFPEEEKAPAVKGEACHLIETLFRRTEESARNLRTGKGIQLFSPENDLPFFAVIQEKLAVELNRRYNSKDDPRVFFQPTTHIGGRDSFDYRRMSIDVEGSYVLITCRGDECDKLMVRLKFLVDTLKEPCTHQYYLRLEKKEEGTWSVEFGKKDDPSIAVQILQPIPIIECLIQSTDSTEEQWWARKASYDDRFTIALQKPSSKKKLFKLILYRGSDGILAPLQKDFYKSVARIFNLHPGPILLKRKPVTLGARIKGFLGKLHFRKPSFLKRKAKGESPVKFVKRTEIGDS